MDELAAGGVLQVQGSSRRLPDTSTVTADPVAKEPDLVEEVVRRGGDAGLKCHRLPHGPSCELLRPSSRCSRCEHVLHHQMIDAADADDVLHRIGEPGTQ